MVALTRAAMRLCMCVQWTPSYTKGVAPGAAALLQLAYCVGPARPAGGGRQAGGSMGRDRAPRPDGRDALVLLLHIKHSGVPPNLKVGGHNNGGSIPCADCVFECWKS
jgi:hypothetical protein